MIWRPVLRAALLACAPAAAACSIPLASGDMGPTNACDSSVDCGSGATCAEVRGQRACVSTSAALEGLILEIRPRAERAQSAEVSHLIDAGALGIHFPSGDPGGQVRSHDLQIPPPALVDATLRMAGSYCGGLDGGQFPVRVELQRVAPVPGLPPQEYSVMSVPNGSDGQRFQLSVPAGTYHIRLVPQAHGACSDDIPPPIFLPGQVVPDRWALDINAQAPAVLKGNLKVPEGVSVDGWRLDLVDPQTGVVISQLRVLDQGVQAPGPTQVPFSLKYYWADEKKRALIRLRPKDGDTRPSVYWELSATALLGSTENLTLSLFQIDDAARRVEGRTLDTSGNPVLSAVRIQSASLEKAQTAGYKLDTETDANGLFRAALPPGEYVIFAQPISDTTRATAARVLKFPAGEDCYCGQTVIIPEAGTLRGRVQGPTGESMDGAGVFAVPSVGEARNYFDRVLEPEQLLPRQASGVLRQGEFSLGVDPGQFDVSVRPAPGSAYPWRVVPRLLVDAEEAVTEVDLAMQYPAVLQGDVLDDMGGRLGGASVVAWLPVRGGDTGEEVTGVIQLGETRSAPDGSYVLPLPPSTSR